MKINGHSGRESIQTQKKDGFVGVVEVDGLLPGTYFAYDIFINGKKYEDESREFGFRTFRRLRKVQSLPSHLADVPVLFQNMNRYGN